MIKGLDNTLKPFLNKVLIEDDYKAKVNKKSQVSLYYETPEGSSVQDQEYKISVTIDFSIKSIVEQSLSLNTFNNIKNNLAVSSLQVLPIANKQSFINFLSLNAEQKVEYLNNFKVSTPAGKRFLGGTGLNFAKEELNKYLSTIDSDTEVAAKQRLLTIPVEVSKTFGKNLSVDKKNPDFLAYIFFLTAGANNVMPSTINSEIIFNDGEVYDKTGYFTIGKTFGFKGQTFELTKTPIPSNSNLIDPLTGQSINPNNQLSENQQVNYLFGAPDDLWVGPVHYHPITDPADPNFGKSRVMAGEKHDATKPHPYLDYTIKGNNKIVDFRATGAFEDLFSYKSSNFEKILAETSDVLYTGQKRNFYVDDLIAKKSIISEGKFSIRPITRQTRKSTDSSTKDNLIFFFAIDKRKLLKQTTKAPQLLEKLTAINPSFYNELTEDLEISHFEIIRINKNTKESKSLIVGNNDSSFNDYNLKNQLGQNISKGFSLVNQTDKINLETEDAVNHVNFYEFTDGEIDAFKDKNTYSYEIKLKFRDPLIEYVTNRLTQIKEIVSNLEELLMKTGFMIKDNNTGRFVSIYDRFQKQLNPTFVSQTLNKSPNAAVPLGFSFDKESELPLIVENSLQTGVSLDNLGTYFLAIKLFSVEDLLSLDVLFESQELVSFVKYVKSSLRLSTTTPTLIEKVKSLMNLLKDKTEKLLSLYSTEQIVKKSSGFTTKDYLKSTGNTKNSDTYVIEFDYHFDSKIDLSETKDYFNWVEEASHIGATGGLKTVSQDAYKFLVQNPTILNDLTEEGQNNFGQENNFSYSFLPYSAPSTLELHKTNKVSVYLNYLQTVRKSLIHNITNTPDSVLIPEILGTFGVRFNLSNRKILEYVGDQLSYNSKNFPINNPIEDNFGSDFSLQPKPVSGFNDYNFSDVKAPAFGSVEDSDYAWQGGEYKDYPFVFGLSLVNLINTNVFARKDINFLNQTYLNLINEEVILDSEVNTANKNVPYSINLFSSAVMSNKQTAETILPNTINGLFAGDELRFTSYSFYSYLLNLFGKVYYLRGLTQRQQDAFAGEPSRFLETTRANNGFIKDLDWEPLSLSVINNIPIGKRILCKVMLFDGQEVSDLLDQKVVNLYKHYYDYNKMFFISGPQAAELAEPVTSIGPTEVPKISFASETRRELENENREFVNVIDEQQRLQNQNVDLKIEDSSTKIARGSASNPREAFTKPRRQ